MCALRSPRAGGGADGSRWRSLRRQPLQHGSRVSGHPDAAPFGDEYALRVDQERAADDTDEAPPVQRLFAEHAERVAPRLVGVGDERERQRVFLAELRVRRGAVARDADDLAVEFSEPVVEVAETVRLAGAAGRRILGIEI